MNLLSSLTLAAACICVTACASVSRECRIDGDEVAGLSAMLGTVHPDPRPDADAAPSSLRVLVVHGIGPHAPGHSRQLIQTLADDLDLQSVDAVTEGRTYSIVKAPGSTGAGDVDGDLVIGELQLHSFASASGDRLMQVYEHTWSQATRYGDLHARLEEALPHLTEASLNNQVREAAISPVVDIVAYVGERHDAVIDSVEQSLCWMLQEELRVARDGDAWGEAPILERCTFDSRSDYRRVGARHYAFITHSLGSDILIQTFQSLGWKLAQPIRREAPRDGAPGLARQLRHKEVTVYMLSNQLPLLQIAHHRHGERMVTGRVADYCAAAVGDVAAKRWLHRMNIAAFSDPNDVLSFKLTRDYVHEYVDSRLCPQVTHVFIPVSSELSILGLVSFVDPRAAHHYRESDGVLAMITGGILRELPALRRSKSICRWVRSDQA